MKRAAIVSVVVIGLVGATGCVSKKRFEESEARLASCEGERQQAVSAAASCQEQAQMEAQRWQELSEAITQEAPAVLSTIQAEKEVFLQQLPEAVRTQVDSYLEKFASDVKKAFALMREQNEKMALRLEEVGATTGRTEGKADRILSQMVERERDLLADATRVQAGIAGAIASVSDFDRTVINCKDCPERLTLSRKERETISAFHGRLIEALSGLRTATASEPTGPAADAGPSSGDDVAASE
jgi:hypothetical protein